MAALTLSSASAILRMSSALPWTRPKGLCTIMMAFSGMITRLPAMAMTLAMLAAMPSM